jgi:hypothetical protein
MQSPNPYAPQPQANPYPQQPQTQNYITRNGIGKRFWFVSRPDNNGCNFALLSYSIFYVPVYFLGRYYVKFEGKKSSTSSGYTVYFSNGQSVNSSRATTVTYDFL